MTEAWAAPKPWASGRCCALHMPAAVVALASRSVKSRLSPVFSCRSLAHHTAPSRGPDPAAHRDDATPTPPSVPASVDVALDRFRYCAQPAANATHLTASTHARRPLGTPRPTLLGTWLRGPGAGRCNVFTSICRVRRNWVSLAHFPLPSASDRLLGNSITLSAPSLALFPERRTSHGYAPAQIRHHHDAQSLPPLRTFPISMHLVPSARLTLMTTTPHRTRRHAALALVRSFESARRASTE